MKKPDFNAVVESHYRGLYAFGLNLTCNPDEALELTQETFSRFAQNGHNIRDLCIQISEPSPNKVLSMNQPDSIKND